MPSPSIVTESSIVWLSKIAVPRPGPLAASVNAAVTVRQDFLDRYPQLADVLDPIAENLPIPQVAAVIGSTAPNGSSVSSTGGSAASARRRRQSKQRVTALARSA